MRGSAIDLEIVDGQELRDDQVRIYLAAVLSEPDDLVHRAVPRHTRVHHLDVRAAVHASQEFLQPHRVRLVVEDAESERLGVA